MAYNSNHVRTPAELLQIESTENPKKRHLTTIPAHLRTEAATSHIPLTSSQRYSRERGNTKLVIGLFLTMSRRLDQEPIARSFQAAGEYSKSNVPKSRENRNLALTQSKYLQFVHRAPTTNGTVQNLLRALMDLMVRPHPEEHSKLVHCGDHYSRWSHPRHCII